MAEEKIDFPPDMTPSRVASVTMALLKAHDPRGTTLVSKLAIQASGGNKESVAILLGLFHELHQNIRQTVHKTSGLKIKARPPPHLAVSVAQAKRAESAAQARISGYYGFEMGWGFDDLVKVITAPARAVINLVTHPVTALHDIANAVSHPLDTLSSAIKAIGSALADTAKMALQAAAMALQVPLVRHLLAAAAQALNVVMPGLGVYVGIAIETAGADAGKLLAKAADNLPGGGIADVINNIRFIPGADALMQVAAQTLGAPGLGQMIAQAPPTVHEDRASTAVAQPLPSSSVVVAPTVPTDTAKNQADATTALALSVVQTRAIQQQAVPAPTAWSLDDLQRAAAAATPPVAPGGRNDSFWATLRAQEGGEAVMGGLLVELLLHMPSVIASVAAQNWVGAWYQKHLARKATTIKLKAPAATFVVHG